MNNLVHGQRLLLTRVRDVGILRTLLSLFQPESRQHPQGTESFGQFKFSLITRESRDRAVDLLNSNYSTHPSPATTSKCALNQPLTLRVGDPHSLSADFNPTCISP